MSKQRIVVVTGGGSGMGKATVELFVANGDFVYIIGRRGTALDVVEKSHPKQVIGFQGDVTKPADVQSFVSYITAKHKIVDVLVNNAGSSGHVDEGLPLETAMDKWKSVVDANLNSVFLMIYALRPFLKRPGGRIINVSSLAAFAGSSRVGGEAYSAAKSGIHGLTRTLVRQLGPEGITVNCVAPGFVESTDFFGGPIDKDRAAAAIAITPARRLGTPEDIAHAVFYLASDKASFVNGEILNVNGGQQFSR